LQGLDARDAKITIVFPSRRSAYLAFDPAYTQHWKFQLFGGFAGNAQQRPRKYPGLADAHFRGLPQTRRAHPPGALTRQNFFAAPMPDQLST
jgi:hypothetical protein